MSFVKIMVHAVWGTKSHQPILTKEIREKVFHHIKENGKSKGLFIDTINGHDNHVHCLLALNADMSISKTIQLIKGESAFWANKNKITNGRIEWANEYFAVSVSESMIEKVRQYIINQEEHHKKITFNEEYNDFIKKYNFLIQG